MAKKDMSYDWLVKLLVIGDSGVGKTNILLRYVDNNFTMNHLTTIGIDFKQKIIELEGKRIKLQVWDTAGQDRFKTITQTYYKGAMGIVLTYAVNDRETFQNIQNWMQQINMHASENVCKILVGNKSDVPDRQVQFQEGKMLADSYGIQFFETSAKEDKNIKEAFYAISKEIKEKLLLAEQNPTLTRSLVNNQSVRLKNNDDRRGGGTGSGAGGSGAGGGGAGGGGGADR